MTKYQQHICEGKKNHESPFLGMHALFVLINHEFFQQIEYDLKL